MKIIHTGDVHLGAAMTSLPPEKATLRKAEILDGFRRLCTYARENSVGAVLIAGDLFDGNRVSASLRAEVLGAIAAAPSTWFFYVSGNHDDEFAFAKNLPKNLFLFSQNHGWQSYELPDGVTVTGIDTRNLSPTCYGGLRLRPDSFNIVLMHGDVTKGGQGQESISLSALQNRNVDYLALGHIHVPTMQAERLDGRGRYRYCGCFEGRGFDECGKRGFFLLEVRDGKLTAEHFLSLAKREIRLCAADISACESYADVERVAFSALKDAKKEDVVKLVLRGRHKAGLRKDLPLLCERLSERFFYAKAEDESRLFIDYKQYENDLSERGEFVRVVGRYEMNEEDRAEILDVGLKALAGEDIDL